MKGGWLTAGISFACLASVISVFVILWWWPQVRPDDGVREICIGSVSSPDWYLAEKRVSNAVYYTIRSGRGDTPWDHRFGAKPGGWLYGVSLSEHELLLQRADGSTWSLDRRSGEVREVPVPQIPLLPLGCFFAESDE